MMTAGHIQLASNDYQFRQEMNLMSEVTRKSTLLKHRWAGVPGFCVFSLLPLVFSGRLWRDLLAGYSAQSFIQGNDRDINFALGFSHGIFCLQLRALSVEQREEVNY